MSGDDKAPTTQWNSGYAGFGAQSKPNALQVPSSVIPAKSEPSTFSYDYNNVGQQLSTAVPYNPMDIYNPTYNFAATYPLPHQQYMENLQYYGGYGYLNRSSQGKRGRMTYQRYQTMFLEDEFSKNAYINRNTRKNLAQATHLSERQVKIWFQNRRMKLKKEKNTPAKEENNAAETSTSGSETGPQSHAVVNTTPSMGLLQSSFSYPMVYPTAQHYSYPTPHWPTFHSKPHENGYQHGVKSEL